MSNKKSQIHSQINRFNRNDDSKKTDKQIRVYGINITARASPIQQKTKEKIMEGQSSDNNRDRIRENNSRYWWF